MGKELKRIEKALKTKKIPVTEDKSGMKSFLRPDKIKAFISNSSNDLEKLLNDYRVHAPTEDFLMVFTAVRGLQATTSYMAIHGRPEQRKIIQDRVDNFLAAATRSLKECKKFNLKAGKGGRLREVN
jgi:hypothetical protein